MARFQASGQSLCALAAALLLTSTSTLPALAALPQMRQGQAALMLSSEGDLLLAENDNKDKKKKKKQKQGQPGSSQSHKEKQVQSQPAKKSDRKATDPSKTKNKQSGTNKKKISDKQRDKIYQEGRQDGLNKGRNKGYDKGYDKGFDAGKKKGKDKAYRNVQRQQWKSWNSNQWKQYNRSRRNIWVNPVRYNRPFYGYPGWAQSPNWGYNRPWGGGWYNSSSPSWSWWGGQALGWGINALTTALIVNNAVNRAIRDRQSTVVVPNSSMQLYYGSVEAMDQTAITFVVANGNYTYEMEADCEDGLLNGDVPTSLAEAELVNTACQVAFGTI
ncbi:MAG: hypothetical protein KFB97_12345 [Cyanobium sp. M30B3]|nr:MAG: hypothetical protein KFB97_12345 [Cyanobium sp. M30B3]